MCDKKNDFGGLGVEGRGLGAGGSDFFYYESKFKIIFFSAAGGGRGLRVGVH